MAELDGKITIEIGLRPCIAHFPEITFDRCCNGEKIDSVLYRNSYERKALFHCWHPVAGNAIVEYEDGTIHEVEPTQIRFVDNAMSEYAFPEMEGK